VLEEDGVGEVVNVDGTYGSLKVVRGKGEGVEVKGWHESELGNNWEAQTRDVLQVVVA